MKKIISKIYTLTFMLILSSCALTNKDFSQNPINISKDEMTGYTWISSNWTSHYSNTSNGYFNPYIGQKDKKTWMRAKVATHTQGGGGSIHYREIRIRCDAHEPIVIKQKPFENWSKDFKFGCGLSSCASSETADIPLEDKHMKYIFKCENDLTIRFVGHAEYIEFRYQKTSTPQFFLGLKDLQTEHERIRN